MNSAAFDLVPITTEAAAKAIRETLVDDHCKPHEAKKHRPTGRRVAALNKSLLRSIGDNQIRELYF